MPVNDEYLNYVLDQLKSAGYVVPKKMFGGVGLYLQSTFFALIANDVLYLKVNSSNREDYEAEDMGPFKPFGEKSYSMQYYEVPLNVLEDQEELKIWANKALAVALKKTKKGKRISSRILRINTETKLNAKMQRKFANVKDFYPFLICRA